MKNTLTIAYIYPNYGGIYAYAQIIKQLYTQAGFTVLDLPQPDAATATDIIRDTSSADVVHFEIGGPQTSLYKASRMLAPGTWQIITIHDPGVVVANPSGLRLEGWKQPLSVVAKVGRKIINTYHKSFVIPVWLRQRGVTVIYLRPDLAKPPHSHYLPQPTYHAAAQAGSKVHSGIRVGFGGYWGREKGVETLLEAWKLLLSDDWYLTMAGGGAADNDAFAAQVRAHITSDCPDIDLPGHIADDAFDTFFDSLDVAIVPYWPELPVGSSAMVMRIAEAGVPIVASDIPALRAQLEGSKTVFVEPKNPTALAHGIEKCIQNLPSYRDAALKYQTELYATHGWSAVEKKLAEIIKSATA